VADRHAGISAALTAFGGGAELIALSTPNLTVASGRAAARQIAEQPAGQRPTAVFCANDLLALGVLQEMTQRGVRVPQDVAIVGYDDSPVAASVRPRLTSVRQPIEEMGHEMARVLILAVEEAEPVQRRVILATELIKRASSAGRPMP